jgi:3-dehydroquinate synthase
MKTISEEFINDGHNVILIGFMGSGKTTVGKRLAERLGYDFVDTDSLIEKLTKKSISEIFELQGEAVFRSIEKKVIAQVVQKKNQVISCGGGAVLYPENADRLRKSGKVVLLSTSLETLYERLRPEISERPLLKTENPQEQIKLLLNKRSATYKKVAHFSVETDNKSVEEVVEEIIKRLRSTNSVMDSYQIKVNLGQDSYVIKVKPGVLTEIASEINKMFPKSKVAIISNETVLQLYEKVLLENFNKLKVSYKVFSLPDGEAYKSLSNAEYVYKELFDYGLERRDVIVAFGGGVIGDLAGFIAATYKRGLPYIQVPTTLVAQVDSSVGGKVAVNFEKVKNIIGAFYQPKAVFIDPQCLKTLPTRHLLNGLAEVIKYGFISSKRLLDYLESNLELITSQNQEALAFIIAESCRIKAQIVELDEKDRNIRSFLNYGHTLGHAIEVVTDYQMLHGEAVALGMLFASFLAYQLNLLSEEEAERHYRVIKKIGLPVQMPEVELDQLIQIIECDKKREKGENIFILLEKIGKPLKKVVPRDVIKKFLADFAQRGGRCEKSTSNPWTKS